MNLGIIIRVLIEFILKVDCWVCRSFKEESNFLLSMCLIIKFLIFILVNSVDERVEFGILVLMFFFNDVDCFCI